jgi:hypothetical protein
MMFHSRFRVWVVVCGVVVGGWAWPASSVAGLFGCNSCATPVVAAPLAVAPAYTAAYAPAYTAAYAPAYTAAYAPAYTAAYAPACASCPSQTCGYMPTPIYRTLYRPAVASYGVTTYRPLFGGWTYEARMVPYATYQPVYTPAPVAAYSGCTSCVNYSSYNAYSPCAAGGCGTVSFAAPSSGCSSCAAPAATVVTAASPTVMVPAPAMAPAPGMAPAAASQPMMTPGNSAAPPQTSGGSPPPSGVEPPRTFEERADKPMGEPEIKPIPQADTHLNSMPAPLLPDPRDRTASRPAYSAARTLFVASPVQASAVLDNDGWQPARD